jgi:hypothetical protein
VHAKAAEEQALKLLNNMVDERAKRRNARSTEDIEQALHEPPLDRTGWTPRWVRPGREAAWLGPGPGRAGLLLLLQGRERPWRRHAQL